MVFVHIEKNDVLQVDRMETMKGVKQVIEDLIAEHGDPIEAVQKDKVTRLIYDESVIFVTRI